MGQTRAEQETTILWDDEERVVRISSAAPPMWRRLARLGVPVEAEDRHPQTGELRVCFYALPLARFRWGLKGGRRRPAVPVRVPAGRRSTTLAEQETVITWRSTDAVVHVHSASSATWRKLARLGFEPTAETHYQGSRELSGRDYEMPLAAFRWGLKRSASPAQVEAAARAAAMRRKTAPARGSCNPVGGEQGQARGVGVEQREPRLS